MGILKGSKDDKKKKHKKTSSENLADYIQLSSFCKSEGLDTDYFISDNKAIGEYHPIKSMIRKACFR